MIMPRSGTAARQPRRLILKGLWIRLPENYLEKKVQNHTQINSLNSSVAHLPINKQLLRFDQ